MNNKNLDLLNLCLEDSLFAALYEALCNLEDKWHTSSPEDMWVKALSARHYLSKSNRPDLLLRQLFVGMGQHEAVIVKAILMWMLFNEDRCKDESPLKDALAKMLEAHGDDWNTVYAEFQESESRNEQTGFNVCQTDYSNNAIPTETHNQERPRDSILAHEMVSYALESYDLERCDALYKILSHIDYQKGHIYEDEVRRLFDKIDEMEKACHEPRKVENNYYKDSCRFEAGSSQNGNILLNQ